MMHVSALSRLPEPSSRSRDLARAYFDWCAEHGFASLSPGAADALFDPENLDPGAVSPFFDPVAYRARAPEAAGVNPYLHYFEGGWRHASFTSRLVDRLYLARRGLELSEDLPLLLQVLAAIDRDPDFSCHPLFDGPFYRRHRRPFSGPALTTFLRAEALTPFSEFVATDMLVDALATRRIGDRNPFLIYLESPLGTDINPMFFSRWYAEHSGRVYDPAQHVRDPLSDYILVGSRAGLFPNPFAAASPDRRVARGDPAALIDFIKVRKYL